MVAVVPCSRGDFPVGLPVAEMADGGRTYFLEVAVAHEVLDDLKSAGRMADDALYERVVRYAINDA